MFLECGRKYDFHYNKKLRPIQMNSALAFGKALDDALNNLLTTKDLASSKQIFLQNYIHSKGEVIFNDNDFDKDLLELINYPKIEKLTELHTKKVKDGVASLTPTETLMYHDSCYASLKEKGGVILDSYNKWVIPKIKQVVVVQDKLSIENDSGDTFEGFIDLIAEFKNGEVYLLDNKTTSYPYSKNSAQESFQLNCYYHFIKNKYQLNGLGFIVANKNLWKKKKKVCKQCQYDGSKASFRTCNQVIDGSRCKGEWDVQLEVTCFIDVILNKSSEVTEQLILETINSVNNNIKTQSYSPNLTHCKQGKLVCSYFNYCYKQDKTGLKG